MTTAESVNRNLLLDRVDGAPAEIVETACTGDPHLDRLLDHAGLNAARNLEALVAVGLPAPRPQEVIGSGFNGTVYATTDPCLVLKVTHARPEAAWMAAQERMRLPGMATCRCAVDGGDGSFLVWRERLPAMGAQQIVNLAGVSHHRLDMVIDLAEDVCGAAQAADGAPDAHARTRRTLAELGAIPGAASLAVGLAAAIHTGLLPCDWSTANLGLNRAGHLVHADPFLITTPWADPALHVVPSVIERRRMVESASADAVSIFATQPTAVMRWPHNPGTSALSRASEAVMAWPGVLIRP